jgi:hypothetical protein
MSDNHLNGAHVPGDPRHVVFIHSSLDDYGLPATAFRVYGHLSRRAGQGVAWPSVATIGRVCRLNPQTVRSALHLLAAHRFLAVQTRPGKTTLYRLTPATAWRPPTRIDGNPSVNDSPLPGSADTLVNVIQGHPSEMTGDEGNPNEGYPQKVFQVPPESPRGDAVNSKVLVPSQEETVYAAYPKKVGMPAALRAIRRALSKWPFEFLLTRTQLYAQTCNSPVEFIPHPATWFNQERFNDDPATWRRAVGTSCGHQPKIVRASQFGDGVSKL